MSAILVLLIVAIICWFLAAIPLPWANPVQLGWLGMFFYGLSMVIGRWPHSQAWGGGPLGVIGLLLVVVVVLMLLGKL